MPRGKVRTRVLVIVAAVVVALIAAAVIADGLLRSRIETELASANSPVTLTLGSQPVLWGYLTGTMHVDAHITAAQVQAAISAKSGVSVGDVTMSDGTIRASLDGGPMSALLGGDVVLELAPHAVDGKLSVAIAGMSVGGVQRAGTALASQFGPFDIDPASMMDCAALTAVTTDAVAVRDDEMVVSVSVPRDAAKEFASCK